MPDILSSVENSLGNASTSIGNSLSSAANNFFTPQGPLPVYASGSDASAAGTTPTGYLVVLSGQDETGTKIGYKNSGFITAFLPEQFEISTTSDWHTLMPSDLGTLLGTGNLSSFAQNSLTALRSLTGISGQIPAFSQLFWVNTSPISFNLNLQFNAVKDAAVEVSGNIQSLLSLTLPSYVLGGAGGLGILKAPGPTLIQGDGPGGGYNINLSIGSNWLFTNVLIQDVSATIDTLPTAKGDYISALVHVRVSTNRVYAKQDLAAAFGGKKQSQAQVDGDFITKLTGLTGSKVDDALSSFSSDIAKLAGSF
jgi:hypothetical protein